jgi:hypothetical protein
MTDAERRRAVLELIHDLFLMAREAMPATKENVQRQAEFAARLAVVREMKEGN